MKLVTENGVTVSLDADHDNPSKATTFYNPVMSICREFVLAGITAYVKGYCNTNQQTIRCLDAFGATGIAGLQWKKHAGRDVHVFINDISSKSIESIRDSCARNDIKRVRVHPDGLPRQQEAAGLLTEENNIVEIVQDDACITMLRQQFHVVHVDPFGSVVPFLDSLFRNVYHNGLVVLTCTDVAALYGKCPDVTSRLYGAATTRTDYTKEMAVRIVLQEAARASAKSNKGFRVLWCVAVEHFVQVGLHIKRGVNHANIAAALSRRLLHCLHCAEWALIPATNQPLVDPYNLLPCNCRCEHPGHTATVLGPLWSGPIMNANFVQDMHSRATTLKLSTRALQTLNLMVEEAKCLGKSDSHTTQLTANSSDTLKDSNKTGESVQRNDNLLTENVNNVSESCSENPNNGETNVDITACEKTQKKRHAESEDRKATKRIKADCENDDIPMMYFNLHRRQIKKINLPKTERIVTLLRDAGHQASRTHFNGRAVRTSARLQELVNLLQQYCPADRPTK